MPHLQPVLLMACSALLVLTGCASRPVNPRIAQIEPKSGYRFETRVGKAEKRENLVILAFSGGGTRAAAFSYGVLEHLRRTEIVTAQGETRRLLDSVDVITGVSGGSFTALAYGLYGDKLFDDYEQRFLKRNVQGELLARALLPANWGTLGGTTTGRSEVAAELYDEILFNSATFADLQRGGGPLVVASATALSTGARFTFTQRQFDVICSDLGKVPLSRAAAASSAVPGLLSPVTFDNHGGQCDIGVAASFKSLLQAEDAPRPSARVIRSMRAEEAFRDSTQRPFLHLVDGGISDNLGMRAVLDTIEFSEAMYSLGLPSPLDGIRRVVVIIVNSNASPATDWDRSERPPGLVQSLLKATGTPIDAFSFEAVELLRDIAARWKTMAMVRDAALAATPSPELAAATRTPDAEIFAIDVSFSALKDPAERAFLNEQPTSFVLTGDAVDRLRAAAGKIIANSPDFQRLLQSVGARVVAEPGSGDAPPERQ
jgi:NTE family protein